MRIGVIDLGSNAFNFLVWEAKSNKMIYETKEFVKIGKGGYYEKVIQPDAIERAITGLKKFHAKANELKVDQLFAFATSAIRTATNKNEVCNIIYKETGIIVNIVNGEQEAELIFNGVDMAMSSTAESSLIMDIGGGSAEFIIFENHEVKWQRSYPLGVSRLLEMYNPSDPISENEKLSVYAYMKNMHNRTEAAILHYKPNRLIGSEGFFKTFYNIIELANGNPILKDTQKEGVFNKHDLIQLAHRIINATYNQRLNMKGMIEYRADTIQFAALSLLYILSVYSFDTIDISNYSLKEGVISSLKENKEQWQESLL